MLPQHVLMIYQSLVQASQYLNRTCPRTMLWRWF